MLMYLFLEAAACIFPTKESFDLGQGWMGLLVWGMAQ